MEVIGGISGLELEEEEVVVVAHGVGRCVGRAQRGILEEWM